ncbi:MAG TPA: DUF4105 domain-containing protein [Pirellulaceae bacterium]|nr:DUF4105 domain-containing protein [Pirellulaceae bacterium]
MHKLIGLTFLIAVTFGCKPLQVNNLQDRLQPSNDRDWNVDMSMLPTAEVVGRHIVLKNVRDCIYATEQDFVIRYFDKSFDLDQIQSVDFILVPFKNPMIAHTMLSFELDNGDYISVSAEIRTEKAEKYSPMLGISNQFELIYVVATERDLIRLRTHHRDADVYIYPTVATPEQSQALFMSILERINGLQQTPEFYHTFKNNCTTNIYEHVTQLQREQSIVNVLQYNWQILLPGFTDRLAYDQGLLRTNVSFLETKRLALVNDLAHIHYDDPHFSQKIRSRQQAMLGLDSADEIMIR